MKIGILTIHHSRNYGAVLQAWACAKTIALLGHSPEIIDYRPRSAVRFYRRSYVKRPHLLLQGLRFHQFIRNELPLSSKTIHDRKDLKEAVGRYDTVVVGSDQIWMNNQVRGFSPEYFLNFIEGDTPNCVSYAPSFGQNTTQEDIPNREVISKALAKFASLSGRDENTCRLIHQYTGRKSTLVLDPTMLIERSAWPTLDSPQDNPYLLAFGTFSSQQISAIKEISNKSGLKIMACGKSFPGADFNYSLAHPLTWLNQVSSAKMVITDFFHGVVFALIFERPFLVMGKESKAIKVKDLLERVGLEDRWLTPDHLLSLVESKSGLDRLIDDVLSFDYTLAAEVISRHRQESIEYLTKALTQ